MQTSWFNVPSNVPSVPGLQDRTVAVPCGRKVLPDRSEAQCHRFREVFRGLPSKQLSPAPSFMHPLILLYFSPGELALPNVVLLRFVATLEYKFHRGRSLFSPGIYVLRLQQWLWKVLDKYLIKSITSSRDLVSCDNYSSIPQVSPASVACPLWTHPPIYTQATSSGTSSPPPPPQTPPRTSRDCR